MPETWSLDSGDRAPSVPAPGERVGRFVVGRWLGEGGMGVVVAGHDPDLNRPVAIKLLRAGSDAPGYRARLLREAQALARVDHPNVVSVYEVGADGDRIYVAMELVEGTTLTRWLGGHRSWREIVAMFLAVGEGLAAVHRAGLVHRDFKPDNVLIDAAGRVRVADFGLARLATEASGEASTESPALGERLTRTGAVMGTPGYMAPEQQWGSDVDARADQYSYCVALRAALTGPAAVKIVTSAPTQTAEQAVRRPLAPGGGAAWRAVPAPVRKAIDRGLSYDASERFATLDDLLAVLRGVIDGRRARIVTALAVGVFVIGIAGAAIGIATRSSTPAAPVAPARVVSMPAVDAAVIEATPIEVVDAPPATAPAGAVATGPAPAPALRSKPRPARDAAPAPPPVKVATRSMDAAPPTTATPTQRSALRAAVKHLGYVGLSAADLGDPAAAEKRLRGELDALTASGAGDDDPRVGQVLAQLGAIRRKRGDCGGAVVLLARAAEGIDSNPRQTDSTTSAWWARAYLGVGLCALAEGRLRDAGRLVAKAYTPMSWGNGKKPDYDEWKVARFLIASARGEDPETMKFEIGQIERAQPLSSGAEAALAAWRAAVPP